MNEVGAGSPFLCTKISLINNKKTNKQNKKEGTEGSTKCKPKEEGKERRSTALLYKIVLVVDQESR